MNLKETKQLLRKRAFVSFGAKIELVDGLYQLTGYTKDDLYIPMGWGIEQEAVYNSLIEEDWSELLKEHNPQEGECIINALLSIESDSDDDSSWIYFVVKEITLDCFGIESNIGVKDIDFITNF